MMMRMLRPAAVAAVLLAVPLASVASAQQFVASKVGKGKIVAKTPQVFTASGVAVECAKASGKIEITELKSSTLDVDKLEYGECTAAGHAATVSDGYYEFAADGALSFTKSLTLELPSDECAIAFPASENHSREKVSYANSKGKLELVLELQKLVAVGSGGVCGSSSDGRYEGTLEVELEGGTIEIT
jgi:hypothetical protein